MHRIDQIYTRHPYYGSPRITAQLVRDGVPNNHKRVERLMRMMGIQALCPRRKTSTPHPAHQTYPYLLRDMTIRRPNQVWGTDLTYVRAQGQWFYLVAILDWYSRYVLAWRLSRSLSVGFCVEAIEAALALGIPEVHNSDQGSQFTSGEYLAVLQRHPDLRISMDGRGRCFDNIFTERLWRTVKYEEVYLHDYQSRYAEAIARRAYAEAACSLRKYFQTYNHERLHSALNYQTPAEVYFRKEKSPEIVKVEIPSMLSTMTV